MYIDPFDGISNTFEIAAKKARMAEYLAETNEVKYREQLAQSLRAFAEATGRLSFGMLSTYSLLEKVERRLDALERDRRKF